MHFACLPAAALRFSTFYFLTLHRWSRRPFTPFFSTYVHTYPTLTHPTQVLRIAGEANKPVVFLFADTQIKDESFVEDISNLLNTYEVGIV